MTDRETDELIRRLDAALGGYFPDFGGGHKEAVLLGADGRVYHVSELLLALLDRIEALEQVIAGESKQGGED